MRIAIGQLRRVIKEEIQRIAEAGFDPKAAVIVPGLGKPKVIPEPTSEELKNAFETIKTKAGIDLHFGRIVTPEELTAAGLEVDPTGVNVKAIGDESRSSAKTLSQSPETVNRGRTPVKIISPVQRPVRPPVSR
jgi:hypothetical protein